MLEGNTLQTVAQLHGHSAALESHEGRKVDSCKGVYIVTFIHYMIEISKLVRKRIEILNNTILNNHAI